MSLEGSLDVEKLDNFNMRNLFVSGEVISFLSVEITLKLNFLKYAWFL